MDERHQKTGNIMPRPDAAEIRTGDKFIIELGEAYESSGFFDCSGDISVRRVYRVKGFETLFIYEKDLERLQKYDEKHFVTAEDLLDKGKKTGKLNHKDLDLLIELNMDGEAIDRFYGELEKAGIEIDYEMETPCGVAGAAKQYESLLSNLEDMLDVYFTNEDEVSALMEGVNYTAKTPNIEKAIALSSLKQEIENMLSSLEPREREILELRFGLRDGQKRTLSHIGLDYGLSEARVGQIIKKARKKIVKPDLIERLKPYFGDNVTVLSVVETV